jgi:hypothetical protein
MTDKYRRLVRGKGHLVLKRSSAPPSKERRDAGELEDTFEFEAIVWPDGTVSRPPNDE